VQQDLLALLDCSYYIYRLRSDNYHTGTSTNLAIAATGNITQASGTGTIIASNLSGTGGQITLAAGVNSTISANNLIISGAQCYWWQL